MESFVINSHLMYEWSSTDTRQITVPVVPVSSVQLTVTDDHVCCICHVLDKECLKGYRNIKINVLTYQEVNDCWSDDQCNHYACIYVSRLNLPSWCLGTEETAHALDNCWQPLYVRVIVNWHSPDNSTDSCCQWRRVDDHWRPCLLELSCRWH